MHMRIEITAVLTASNGRETVSLFANYTSSKGGSIETVETPVDLPLKGEGKLGGGGRGREGRRRGEEWKGGGGGGGGGVCGWRRGKGVS